MLNKGSASSTRGSGTAPTVAYSVNAASNLLVVGAYAFDAVTQDSLTGVKYNNVAMTFINKVQTNAAGPFIYFYYLAKPATGSNNIEMDYSVSQGAGDPYVAADYSGAGAIDVSHVTSNTLANSLSDTFTVGTNVYAISWTDMPNGAANPAASTGLTLRATQNVASIGDSNGTVSGSQTFAWTYGATDRCAMITASFVPAPSSNFFLLF